MAGWDALALFVCAHGIRPHRALRERVEGLPGGRRYRPRMPAMAIGLAEPVWSWEEFLAFTHYHYKKE